MERVDIDQVDGINDNYPTLVKDTTNILNEINFETDDDELIMKSIINNLEKEAYKAIKDGLIVSIPYIGCVRKNATVRKLNERSNELKESYRNMTPEEFKEYRRQVVKDVTLELKYENYVKGALRRLKALNREKYDDLTFIHGIHYANVWIKSIFWLKDVPFDPEVQAAYDRLKE